MEFQNPNSLAVLSCTGDSPWTVFPVSRTKAQAWLLLGVGLKYIKDLVWCWQGSHLTFWFSGESKCPGKNLGIWSFYCQLPPSDLTQVEPMDKDEKRIPLTSCPLLSGPELSNHILSTFLGRHPIAHVYLKRLSLR